MAIQWDIRTPNPMVPLQAAALGETMRRNRMQEQRWARQDEAAAEKARRDAERYGLEQTRAALTDYARLNQAVAALPAEQQDAAFARGMQFLRATHPTRNGVDPWATVTDRLEAGEQENLAALSPFVEAQGESYALKQGVNTETGELEWFRVGETSGAVQPTGLQAPPRTPLVSMGGETPLGLDARSWRNEAGESPSANLTASAAVAAGFQPVTRAQEAREVERAKSLEQRDQALADVDGAMADYEKRLADYERDRTPETQRLVEEARVAVGLARQNLLNKDRELSAQMQDRLMPPTAVGSEIERMGSAVSRGVRRAFPDAAPGATATPAPVGSVPGATLQSEEMPPDLTPQEQQRLQELRRKQGG